jgi:pimeloyl-ACP methyl ester carboxylesterase
LRCIKWPGNQDIMVWTALVFTGNSVRSLPAARLFLVMFVFPGGCMTTPRREVHSPPPAGERGIVFSADGAGGFEATSNALRDVVASTGLPLCVEAVPWSHGYCRVIADQVDWCYARKQGEALAARIVNLRAACPDLEIYVLGHSAGAAVALSAVEALPPGSIDRLILLAPSISTEYDMRPALRVPRDGIDVFFSGRDVGYLGLGILIFGTADRRWCPAAGRVGFQPICTCPEDTALYAKLRQHPWHPCQAWTGNFGGHYGSYRPGFLAAYILQLLHRNAQCPAVTDVPPAAAQS